MPDDTPASRRKAIPRRLRFEILRRDGHTCRYCGAKAPDVTLHVDHVVPVALGGSDSPDNLTTACEDCNQGKGSSSPDEVTVELVAESARAMADALHLATQERREQRELIKQTLEIFAALWSDWSPKKSDTEIPRPDDWDVSIERFVSLGLDIDDLERCLRVAMTGPARHDGVWSYFCGVAWNEVRDLHRSAQRMVERTEEDV